MHAIWAVAFAAWPSLISDAEPPRPARVVSEFVDVLDQPDDASFSTGRLARGGKVAIVRDGPDGWFTIAPPGGSFSFVEESELEDQGDGRAKVLARFATVRTGREGARVPGPPRLTLRQGSVVRLLDRRPIVRSQGGKVQTWIPIAPPAGEVRFVRAAAIQEDAEGDPEQPKSGRRDRLTARREDEQTEESDPPSPPKSRIPEVGPVDGDFLSVGPPPSNDGVSAEVAQRIKTIAERHRTELRKPMDRWNLAPIQADYDAILKGGIEASDRRAIQSRLDLVRNQAKAADAASRMAKLVARSRERDGRGRLDPFGDEKDAGVDRGRGYDATGLLQTTSRSVDGGAVYALIGMDGAVVAYLSIPPGVIVRPLISRRVGVRGQGRFNEALMARLILVRDLESLEGSAKTPIRQPPKR